MAVVPFNATTGRFNTQTAGMTTPDGILSATNAFDVLRIPDIDPMFHMLNDGSALFYRILSMLSKEAPSNEPRFEFFEDDKYPVRMNVTVGRADLIAGDITVDNPVVAVNSVLRNATTFEHLLVTAVAGSVITVARGHQGSTPANIVAADELIVLGTTLPEGADANDGFAILPTVDYNYISFFSQGVKSTDINELTNMLNGAGQMPNEFRKQTLLLMEQIDQHLRWGKRSTTTIGGDTVYYTGGFDDRVTGSETLSIAGLDWALLNTTFNDYFLPTNSSPTKTLLCGQTLFSEITAIAWDHFTTGGTPTFQTSLGATVQQIVLDGGGVVDVVLDKYGFRGTALAGTGFLIDMANIALKPFNGFDMVWREVTEPASHTNKFELYSSAGLKVLHGADEVHATVSLVN